MSKVKEPKTITTEVQIWRVNERKIAIAIGRERVINVRADQPSAYNGVDRSLRDHGK